MIRRLLLTLCVMLVVAAPALASGAKHGLRAMHGTVTALSDESIVVQQGDHQVTCRRGKHSPTIEGIAVGDTVAILCRKRHRGLVLLRVKKLDEQALTGNAGQPVAIAGLITALADDAGVQAMRLTPKDYRRLKMERLRAYHVAKPGGTGPKRKSRAFSRRLEDIEEERQPLDVEGRRIPYRKRASGWSRSISPRCAAAARLRRLCGPGDALPAPCAARPACRRCRRKTPTPRGASPGGLVDVFYDDRVKLFVGAEAAGRAVHRGREQRRVRTHREPADRDAVGAICAGGTRSRDRGGRGRGAHGGGDGGFAAGRNGGGAQGACAVRRDGLQVAAVPRRPPAARLLPAAP